MEELEVMADLDRADNRMLQNSFHMMKSRLWGRIHKSHLSNLCQQGEAAAHDSKASLPLLQTTLQRWVHRCTEAVSAEIDLMLGTTLE